MKDTAELYKDLIDEETHAFIRETESWYPPDTTSNSIRQQREIYNAMCQAFYAGQVAGVSARDDTIQSSEHTIPVRHYSQLTRADTNHKTQLVYFHGGGFVVGGLQSHDDICSEICAATGITVTSVDYRLSPEHPHPAAFNDALATVKTLFQIHSAPLILCGDSAGGNLAACVAHAVREQPIRIAGQVLIYPGLGGDMQSGSYITHAHAPMLTTEEVEFYASIRSPGRSPGSKSKGDTTLAPLHDTDFGNLPRTVVFSAECDPLCDDGRHYCDAINAAGGNAEWFKEQGLVHGYLRARHTVTRAKDSFERIVTSIKTMALQTHGNSSHTV